MKIISTNRTELMQSVHDLKDEQLLKEYDYYQKNKNKLTPIEYDIYLFVIHEMFYRRIGHYSTYPKDMGK